MTIPMLCLVVALVSIRPTIETGRFNQWALAQGPLVKGPAAGHAVPHRPHTSIHGKYSLLFLLNDKTFLEEEKLLKKIEKDLKVDGLGTSLHFYNYILDPCISHPCWNLGRCESTPSGYHCHCNAFYTGVNCEKAIRRCDVDVCNQGECVLKKTIPYFKCRCHYPYHGATCHLASNVCSLNPCKNGGICVVRNKDEFRCVCPLPYGGKFCEIGPHDCYRNDGLQYRGQISHTVRGFRCLPWDSYLLAKESVNAFVSGIYMTGISEHNYCRNPDGSEKPWCFFQDHYGELRWEVCDVPVCTQSPIIRSSYPVIKPADTTAQAPSPSVIKGNITFSSCGIKILPGNVTRGRIFGGKRTHPGKHPWLASLQLKVAIPPFSAGHLCGGTLIGDCWVLTAAHCVKPLSQPQIWRVILGKMDLQKKEVNEQAFDVKRIIIHELYREREMSLHNDIALIELKKINKTCAKETMFVRTACLANREFSPGKACVIAGWGKTETGFVPHLLDATVQIISQANCTDPKSYGKLIDNSMLCAGVPEGGTDSCQGDSGGPLVCERGGVSQVVGVVSWGDNCGLKDKPGVYAHVHKFADWIKNNMKGNVTGTVTTR
ncbi:factor VII-activating protease [Pelodytes ibericus]